MRQLRKFALGAVSAGVMALSPMAASAETIQLGFILDRSGSIGDANWTTIANGLASAINTYIPVGGPDTYEISVVTFSASAAANIQNYLVNSVAARTTLAANIAALGALGASGATNYTAAFQTMLDTLDNSTIGLSYVNFATDGDPNPDSANGLAARTAMIAAGVDNISIEGIGSSVSAANLQNNYCYPAPCDSTNPYDFPAKGFYIGVDSAQEYADAIALKIRVVTGQVPEPGSLALVGLALAGLGLSRRTKPAAA